MVRDENELSELSNNNMNPSGSFYPRHSQWRITSKESNISLLTCAKGLKHPLIVCQMAMYKKKKGQCGKIEH